MFGRSQSGPGGLSINTNSANSLIVPGDTSGAQSESKPVDGGPFGSSLNSSQAQQSGGLFGASTSQPQQSTGLFGATVSQPQQSSGLFGTSTSNQSGGVFGSQGINTQQQQAGGVFGNLSQSQGGSTLFGANNAQSTATQQSGGGLFASLGQNQNQNPAPQLQTSNMFGNQNRRSTLFGDTTTQDTQNQLRPTFGTQPSNLAQSQQQPLPSIFSSSIGQYSQQQQSIPGVRINVNELRPTSRFNDLHEELQKAIENVDNFIQGQIWFQQQCGAAMDTIGTVSNDMPNDVEYCTRTLGTLQQVLENDADAIGHAKGLIRTDAANARLSFKIVRNLKMPAQFHHSGLWNASTASQVLVPSRADQDLEDGATGDLVSYFSKQAEDMSKTLDNYKSSIAEVESYMKGIEANTMQQMQRMMFVRGRDGGKRSAEDQVRELAAVLREFENGILGVAGRVGGARETILGMMLGDSGDAGVKSTTRFGTL